MAARSLTPMVANLAPALLPGEALREIFTADCLRTWIQEARQRTLSLVNDLRDDQLSASAPGMPAPILWELGHLGWFQERWVLRRRGEESLQEGADRLYDPALAPGPGRDLPGRATTLAYLRGVTERMQERLRLGGPSVEDVYFNLLAVFWEDMKAERIASARQGLGYPAPPLIAKRGGEGPGAGPLLGDVAIPGGRFLLGALPGEPFVFDNEKWAHPVTIRPFCIARAPVTQEAFLAFVEANGYRRREWWSEAGWGWRESVGARHPLYWERQGTGWGRREFGRWVPLEPHRPLVHVNYYEAEAYCRWGNRRLPTEVEWEVAAAGEPAGDGRAIGPAKRRFPWGETPPTEQQANLDGRRLGCLDVADCPDGDSAWGCRQAIGNVWEWTSSDLTPFPGFMVDPYPDYSRPHFGTHRVLRGGCWMTRARLLRNTWRHFSAPDRRDLFAGFRTCALSAEK